MSISKRGTVLVFAAAAVALSLTFAVGAFAASHTSHASKHRHPAQIISETMAPSLPTDPMLHGVAPGSAPWVLKSGNVSLLSNGKLDLRLTGLVIPSLGTAGPVTMVSASGSTRT